VFYSLFVCTSAYANAYFKTILRKCLRAGLTSGFPSTAPPPVCVLAVLGMLAVWIPNQKNKKIVRSGVRTHGLDVWFGHLFRSLSGGQGLGCPWGVVTPTKKKVSVPFSSKQKKSVTFPSNSRNPLGHVR